jgi:hypothetical protein
MSSSYEIMTRAMNILDGPGSIQERLASAYRTEVQYVGPEGLDEKMLETLEMINDELTSVEAEGDKDSIDMSTQMLSESDAQDLVNHIRGIYQYLSTHH